MAVKGGMNRETGIDTRALPGSWWELTMSCGSSALSSVVTWGEGGTEGGLRRRGSVYTHS